MNHPISQNRSPEISYRCVCGESFRIPDGAAVTCPKCARHYSANAFRNRLAETASVYLNEEGQPVYAAPAPLENDLPDPRLHTKLDHFLLESRLGRGGMGSVYRALDESLQRYVAVKLIEANSAPPDAAHQQRLVQEARAQARVNHPHVVHIYYVGRDAQAPFFAMELVNGPTLGDRLKDGPLPFADVVEIALQVVDALRHAANFDIVHGDIKPSNILLADGRTNVKLSDFGLAQRLSRGAAGNAFTQGTPHYLPPEALRGERRDIRGDMYSLGIMLFEMTFGRLPYKTVSGLAAQLEAHESSPPEFPSPWPAGVPDLWRSVLTRLLQKSPADRYPTYDALANDLLRLRPAALPAAGLAPRTFAWLVDLALASAAQGIFFRAFDTLRENPQYLNSPSLQNLILLLTLALSALPPFAAAWLQSIWKTSPGKRLFQLRIVAEHGLPPPPFILALRACWQLAPMHWAALNQILLYFGQPSLGLLLGAVVFLVLAVDAALAAFYPKGISLHDRLFSTRVVLDFRDPQFHSN